MAGRVLEYYWLLRSVLRERPEVRHCLCRCRHCRIYFITDPRNAGRQDLGCPFGCREALRKQESTRRSVDYYRSAEGKIKKRLQNSKRSRVAGRETSVAKEEPEPEEAADESRSDEARGRWSEPLVEHVRMVCSVIEGRRISRNEILEMLGKVLRQHRMARRRRIDHVVAQLNQNPP